VLLHLSSVYRFCQQGTVRHAYQLLVTGPPRWIAGVVGGMLAVLAVGVLVGPRLLHVTASRPVVTHSTVDSLPAGVCSLSTEGWPAGLTRIEGKLVTYRAFFGLPTPEPASSARTTWRSTPAPPYFWVIAATGAYDLGPIPMPAPGIGHSIVHSLSTYVRADQCIPGAAITFPFKTYVMVDGWPVSGLTAGGDGWPAFFDRLPAVVQIKIR
jgi:hypothetical protein